MLQIPADQVKDKKQIGELDGDPVIELSTVGGLHVVVRAKRKGSGSEILGTGSHRAIARHIAQKQEPRLKVTELTKSDWYPVESFQHLLPRYEALTVELRACHGS